MNTRPSTGHRRALGIDFGTTNSAVAIVDDQGPPRLARFATEHGESETFRSILFFEGRRSRTAGGESVFAGPAAIEHYLHASQKGRFIQSLKTYLGDRELHRHAHRRAPADARGTDRPDHPEAARRGCGVAGPAAHARGRRAPGALHRGAERRRRCVRALAADGGAPDRRHHRADLRVRAGRGGLRLPAAPAGAGHRVDRRLRGRHERLLDPLARARVGGRLDGHHHPRHRRPCVCGRRLRSRDRAPRGGAAAGQGVGVPLAAGQDPADARVGVRAARALAPLVVPEVAGHHRDARARPANVDGPQPDPFAPAPGGRRPGLRAAHARQPDQDRAVLGDRGHAAVSAVAGGGGMAGHARGVRGLARAEPRGHRRHAWISCWRARGCRPRRSTRSS